MRYQRPLFRSWNFTSFYHTRPASSPRTFSNTGFRLSMRHTKGEMQLATEPIEAGFIPSLQQPTQQILWIGCSDSSFEETTILNLLPDETLVLRNIGNMIIDGDLSCETAVKHAVVDLKIKHIIVCGHYGCDIVKATPREGLKGPWLSKLDSLHQANEKYINKLPTDQHDCSFVKMNILEQLRSLRKFPEVANAMRQGRLQVHGIVYDPESKGAHRLLED